MLSVLWPSGIVIKFLLKNFVTYLMLLPKSMSKDFGDELKSIYNFFDAPCNNVTHTAVEIARKINFSIQIFGWYS